MGQSLKRAARTKTRILQRLHRALFKESQLAPIAVRVESELGSAVRSNAALSFAGHSRWRCSPRAGRLCLTASAFVSAFGDYA
ncbi:MAG TPA: hypothetical protein VFS67_02820 [Polyangiaceae bacterium]|nr:hypothetical protein [Polyangiaceae bacterium]